MVEITTVRPYGHMMKGGGEVLGKALIPAFVTEGIHPRVLAVSNTLGNPWHGRAANSRHHPKTGGSPSPTPRAPSASSPCPVPRANARSSSSARSNPSSSASPERASTSRPCGLRQGAKRTGIVGVLETPAFPASFKVRLNV